MLLADHYEVEITRSRRSARAGQDRKGFEVHHARCCAVRIDAYIGGGRGPMCGERLSVANDMAANDVQQAYAVHIIRRRRGL